MGAQRGESDFENGPGAAPGMEGRAAPALAVRIDQRFDRRLKAGMRQRRDDEAVLPLPVALDDPVLDRASAADAEVRADGRNALVARRDHPQQVAAIRMAGNRLHLHRLAGQRVGRIDGTLRGVRDAVAAMAEAHDGQLFDHTCVRPRPGCGSQISGASRVGNRRASNQSCGR